MVFAIATRSSVYFYDTQQKTPFACVSNIHYARLTDLAWTENGEILVVSSTDGFCSIIAFEKGELGEIYTGDPKKLQDVINIKSQETELKTPGIIEIPSDKILSVDRKFSSPEKKDKPVTPIAIRRHPRTTETTSKDEKTINKTPPKDEKASNTPKTSKTPQPIAIRRQPRSNTLEPKKPETSHKITQNMDEAVDAWPIDEPKPILETFMSPGESDKTQDIVLVVEDESSPAKSPAKSPQKTEEQMDVDMDETKPEETLSDEAPKTPRRVEFRTISTPKSKKKLL